MRPTEINKERFHEMLNILPPENWINRGREESFLLSERSSGTMGTFFVRIGERYFEMQGEETLLHSECVSAVMSAIEAEPATYQFDPALVRIDRHRLSVTQGEFSIFYRDQLVIRYGDKIALTGQKDPYGHSEWAGYPDDEILKFARRLYIEGDPRNSVEPLCYRDILDLFKQDKAVVLSNEMFDALSFDPLPSDVASRMASIANPKQLGIKDAWLVGTQEALQQVAPLQMADHAMRNLIGTLKSRYPEAGLSFGYIGNLERWGDDRNWRVFTTVKNPRDERNCHSWGYANTDELPKLAQKAERDLETWVRRVVGKEPWPEVKRHAKPSTDLGM